MAAGPFDAIDATRLTPLDPDMAAGKLGEFVPCGSPSSNGRRELGKRQRRECIIETAYRVFLERGFSATSMSGIAAAIGGSKSTLWSYFRTKDELFQAVVDARFEAFARALDHALTPADEIKDSLLAFGRVLLAKTTSPETIAFHRMVIAECGRFPILGEIYLKTGPEQVTAQVAAFLGHGMDRGKLRKTDPLLAASHLVSLCVAGCYPDRFWTKSQPSPVALEVRIRASIDTFMRAWQPDAPVAS